MKNLFKLILITTILSLPYYSHALFFVEPSAGIHTGDTKIEQNDDGIFYAHDGFILGGEIGAKAGISILFLRFGMEYNYARQSIRAKRQLKNGSFLDVSTYSNSFQRQLLGPYISFKLPILFKLFASYYFWNQTKATYAKPKASNPFNKSSKLEGRGWGFGIGFTSIPIIDLSCGVRLLEYTKFKEIAGERRLPDYNLSRYKVIEVFLSVDIPIDLPIIGG